VSIPSLADYHRAPVDAAVGTTGVTLRRTVDCRIAAVARRREAASLAYDAGIDRVARVIAMDIDEAFLRHKPQHVRRDSV